MYSQGGKFLSKRMMQASMCLARNILDLKDINKLKSEANKRCTLNIFFFGFIFLSIGTHVKKGGQSRF